MNSIYACRRTVICIYFALFAVLVANEAFAVAFHIRTTVYAFKDNDPAFSDFISEPGTGGTYHATISSDGSLSNPTTMATPIEWRASNGAIGLTDRDGNSTIGYFDIGDYVFIESLGWLHIEDICAACLSKGSVDLWTATGTYPDDIGALDVDGGRDVEVFHNLADIPADLAARKADPAIWKSSLWTDDDHRRRNGNGKSIVVDGVALPPLAVPEPATALLMFLGMLGLIRSRRQP